MKWVFSMVLLYRYNVPAANVRLPVPVAEDAGQAAAYPREDAQPVAGVWAQLGGDAAPAGGQSAGGRRARGAGHSRARSAHQPLPHGGGHAAAQVGAGHHPGLQQPGL